MCGNPLRTIYAQMTYANVTSATYVAFTRCARCTIQSACCTNKTVDSLLNCSSSKMSASRRSGAKPTAIPYPQRRYTKIVISKTCVMEATQTDGEDIEQDMPTVVVDAPKKDIVKIAPKVSVVKPKPRPTSKPKVALENRKPFVSTVAPIYRPMHRGTNSFTEQLYTYRLPQTLFNQFV